MVITIITVLIIVIAAVSGGGILITSKERNEGKNLSIANIDFKKIKDGKYIGKYEGGMYKWRTNQVQVTVSSGKVMDIKVLMKKEGKTPEFFNELYGRVIKAQSLQVDTISAATITSKAFLKSVENALINADKN